MNELGGRSAARQTLPTEAFDPAGCWVSSGRLPVFQTELRDAGELGDVVGHQREIVCERERGDEQVVGSGDLSASLEISSNHGVPLCGYVVERERFVASEEGSLNDEVPFAPRASLRPVRQADIVLAAPAATPRRCS